jgi:hypothetical protein
VCSKGTCGKTENGRFLCTETIESVAFWPYRCTAGTVCLSKTDRVTGIQLEKECVCGRNRDGLAYCEQFYGDVYGKMMMESVRKWVTGKEVRNCNTMKRMDESCMKEWWGEEKVRKYLYYYYLFYYYPYLANIEECVKNTIFPEFNEIELALSFAIRANLPVIFIILLSQ